MFIYQKNSVINIYSASNLLRMTSWLNNEEIEFHLQHGCQGEVTPSKIVSFKSYFEDPQAPAIKDIFFNSRRISCTTIINIIILVQGTIL